MQIKYVMYSVLCGLHMGFLFSKAQSTPKLSKNTDSLNATQYKFLAYMDDGELDLAYATIMSYTGSNDQKKKMYDVAITETEAFLQKLKTLEEDNIRDIQLLKKTLMKNVLLGLGSGVGGAVTVAATLNNTSKTGTELDASNQSFFETIKNNKGPAFQAAAIGTVGGGIGGGMIGLTAAALQSLKPIRNLISLIEDDFPLIKEQKTYAEIVLSKLKSDQAALEREIVAIEAAARSIKTEQFLGQEEAPASSQRRSSSSVRRSVRRR